MLLSSGQIATQAFAEENPQIAQAVYYPEAMGLNLEDRFATYGAIYRSQPWTRTVVDKVANAVARLTINVWNEEDPKKRTIDLTGPYAQLIAKPSAILDKYAFWLWLESTIEIYGEAYLLKLRNDRNQVQSLEPIHPSRIALQRNKETGAYEYLWQTAGSSVGVMTLPESEVVPFRLYNPHGLERGLSRMESLRTTLLSEDSSRRATSAMWKNAGRPNVMLTVNKRLDDMAQARLRSQFDSAHAGSSNAGKTIVLEDGMDVKELQLTAVEMQFIESRQLNREEICAVFDVAPPMVHILDRATFSNITAQMRAFYRDTMTPRLEFLESVLDHYVGSEFNLAKRATFAVTDILRGDYEQRGEVVAALVTCGVMKPSEGRDLMELNDAGPIADKLYANSALQPLGAPPSGDPQLTDGASNMTHVPSPSGGPGTHVPSPAPRRVENEPQTALPSAKPKPKHLRAVKGALGRGAEIQEFAMQLAKKHPGDLEDILLAVQIAIEGRDAS